jgi:hypothetical protein
VTLLLQDAPFSLAIANFVVAISHTADILNRDSSLMVGKLTVYGREQSGE